MFYKISELHIEEEIMTENDPTKRIRFRDDRFTFKAVYSDESMTEADRDALWDILIKALVNRYEAEFPEKFEPCKHPTGIDNQETD